MYLQQIQPLVDRAASATSRVVDILNGVSNGTITPTDGAAQVRLQRSELATIRAEVAAIIPPPNLVSAHTHLLASTDLMIQAFDKFALGIETQNPTLIEEGFNLTEQSAFEFDLFVDELQANLPAEPSKSFNETTKGFSIGFWPGFCSLQGPGLEQPMFKQRLLDLETSSYSLYNHGGGIVVKSTATEVFCIIYNRF